MLFRLALILMLSLGPVGSLGFGGPWADPASAGDGPMPGMSCGPDGTCCCVLNASCGCAIDAPDQTPAPKAPAPAPQQRPDLNATAEHASAALPDDERPRASIRWSVVTSTQAWSESSRALWNVWRT